MKNITIISILLSIFILTGCNDNNSINQKITEEKAIQIVLDQHIREDSDIEILSVVCKSNKYIIEWENDPIEEGKDSVNKETGELKMVESSRGTCQWR